MRLYLKAVVVVVACALLVNGIGGVADAAPVMNIQILKDADFNAEHGVSSGNGTKAKPYLFSGLDLNSLQISDTSKYVEIKKNTIAGNLVLDWMGDHVKVHYNSIGQLHVNRNVKRTGPPTSGTIVHNRIGQLTQLRHWDGLFQYNTIGTPDTRNTQANFDGFNGAKLDHNTIYGFADVRLHGHHHSSGYGMPSHMHDGMDNMTVDHTQRYHTVSFTNNVISTTHDYALAYLDTGHAGNDRTATSETDKALEEPHAHHTQVRFAGNRLTGGGILVDTFNATDQRHLRTYQGRLTIEHNRITLGKDDFFSTKQLNGIEMRNAIDVKTVIKANSITGWKPNGFLSFLERWDSNAGILLQNVDKADVWLVDNSVANRTYGIRAQNFTVSVRWLIGRLKTSNVGERVHSDNVPRRPEAA